MTTTTTAPAHDEKILARITKLLNLAGNNPSEEEAEAAMIKAQELMLGHSITMADIASYDGESRTKIEATYAEYTCDTGKSRTPSWRAMLGWQVAKNMGGEAVRTPSFGVKSHGTFQPGKMTFFALGEESLESMLEVYRYLELQLDLQSASATRRRPPTEVFDYRTGEYKQVRRGGHAWRLAWLAGAIERLSQRLEEQYKLIEAEGDNSKALVLVRDAVRDKVQEVFGTLRYSRFGSKNYHAGAYRAGVAAANQMDLGGAKLGGGRLGLPA